MDIYTKAKIGELLKDNSYQGRGIIIGKTPDGKKAAIGYFIMGRSENSRNRVFKEVENDLAISFYDESKVEDPSLIMYWPIKVAKDKTIVTNGDQTDTIYDHIMEGKTFSQALATREFEPDSPNFTPRISGIINELGADFTYDLSILKSMDEEGKACARYFYCYKAEAGLGHFIHTYVKDENPLPTFQGEPIRLEIPMDIDEFTNDIWSNLNEDNKISLYTRYIDLSTGEFEKRLINKNL